MTCVVTCAVTFQFVVTCVVTYAVTCVVTCVTAWLYTMLYSRIIVSLSMGQGECWEAQHWELSDLDHYREDIGVHRVAGLRSKGVSVITQESGGGWRGGGGGGGRDDESESWPRWETGR